MPADQQTEITTFVAADDEWWTPQWIIEAARATLGRIDLDPASTFDANKRTNAVIFYTREDNGLEKKWYGTVFLNPPSKRGDPTCHPHLWAKKLIREYNGGHVSRAILVVKSVLGYKWYEELYQRFWVCHLRERPAFVRPDGTTVGMAKKGVSVFYLGDVEHRIKFVYHFGNHGKIVSPLGAAGGLLFSESGKL